MSFCARDMRVKSQEGQMHKEFDTKKMNVTNVINTNVNLANIYVDFI